MSGLRVGIDGEALRRPLSGVGHYVFALCRELEALWPEAEFFAYARLPAERLALPSARWHLRQEPLPALRRIPSFAWLRTRGRQLAQADRLDVFWAGRTLHPRLPVPVRTVCTVHDLNHLLVPETMELPTRWSHRLWFAGDLKRADAVLANSQGTAQRLRERLGVAVDAVVTPGLAPHFRPLSEPESQAAAVRLAAVDIVAPYLLSVATLEPRKNVAGLLRAFVALKRAGELPDHRLVLVGARGWQQMPLERELAAARELGVVIAGYVPDDMMPALYAGAEALVCPSFYEGFGMPVLEARACGSRVLVADVPELREAGGPHAVVVPPTIDGLRDGLKRVLAQPHRPEADLARRHAWRAGALRLAAALQGRTDAEPARTTTAGSLP